MAAANLTTLDGLFKEVYMPRIRGQFYKDVPAYKRLQRQTDKSVFNGKTTHIAAHYRRSQAVGARAELAALPAAQQQGITQMTLEVKRIYGKIKLSGPVVRQSKSNTGAFASALRMEMDGIRESVGYDVGRQIVFGDGTGKLAQASGAGTATTALVVDNPGVDHLYEGMLIDIYTSGGTQEVNSIEITAVNRSTNTVTLASAQTWSNDSFVYREDARNEEVTGLAAILDDGTRASTFQGLSRSTYTWLNANMLGNSGTNRSLTLRLVDDLCLEAQKNGGGGNGPSAIYSQHVHSQNYADLCRVDRRFNPEVMTLDGGYEAVEVTHRGGKCVWISDRMCRDNEIWGVREDDLILFELTPLDWWDEDGTVLHRALDGSDALEAMMLTEMQLGAQCCNRSTVLDDISES
jgi:hypothetical protein